jgi:LmbE family N-acetylglucosaminyl deacetylase
MSTDTPSTAMSIQAHPDDQEFTVAGTLAKWVRLGCQVTSVVLTSGEAGTNDPTYDPSRKTELANLREAEQLAANAVLGIQHTVFLHFPDGILQHTLDLRKAITREIRRFRPEVIVCGDPTMRFFGNGYINHPDHRAAADAACDAAFPSAGSRPIFPELLAEGFPPHDVKRVYLHGSDKEDTWIDISDTIDLKVEALRKHVSQIGNWDAGTELRRWAAENGEHHGLAYAESYRVMILSED